MTVTPIRPMAPFIEPARSLVRPGSVVVAEWTGARADALMRAYGRYTVKQFAKRMGVHDRTVLRWRANPQIVVSAWCAEVLDKLLSGMSAAATARFVELSGITPVDDLSATADGDELRARVATLTYQVEALTSALARHFGDCTARDFGTAVSA